MKSPGALFALGLALCTALFFAVFERSSTLRSGPLAAEAARNPFLALERLLSALGGDVQHSEWLDALDPLPEPGTALFIPGPRRGLTRERAERLHAWVRRGGHLIAVTWTLWDDPDRRPDSLIDPLGIRQIFGGSNDALDSDDRTEDWSQALDEPSLEGRTYWSSGPEGAALELRFDRRYRLELDASRSSALVLESANGAHLISVPEGAGHLTVLTDALWLRNDAIGELDHATAALELVRLFGGSGDLALVAGDSVAQIGPEFWWRLWPLALALAALVACYLLSRLPRVGPIVPDREPGRRALMEHVLACGRLRVRAEGAPILLRPVRRALQRRIERRHPRWLELPRRELAAQLAAGSGLSGEAIERGLFDQPATPREIAEFISTLESVRRRL